MGFRGQGDQSFWREVPEVETDDDRRAYVLEVLGFQRQLLEEMYGNDNMPPMLFNLYGELLMLFKPRLDLIPEDVILCWADNGYGQMNVRITADTDPSELAGSRRAAGSAAGGLLPPQLPRPARLEQAGDAGGPGPNGRAISTARQAGTSPPFRSATADRCGRTVTSWICSGRWTRNDVQDDQAEQVVQDHGRAFAASISPPIPTPAAELYRDFFRHPFIYMPGRDDYRAGDEFYNYFTRFCIGQVARLAALADAGLAHPPRVGSSRTDALGHRAGPGCPARLGRASPALPGILRQAAGGRRRRSSAKICCSRPPSTAWATVR